MWPFDQHFDRRSNSAEALRLGRQTLERWAEGPRGTLSLVASQPWTFNPADPTAGLVDALRALGMGEAKGRVTLLLESAWLPVVLADTGAVMLRATQVEALIRHRLGLNFASSHSPVSSWELRIEQRAGAPYAVAFGLAPHIKQGVLAAGESVGVTWHSLQPALSWAAQHLRPALRHAWWVLAEQDRLLVAQISGGEMVSLNPGAETVHDEAGVLRLIESEAVRCGMPPDELPIVVSYWPGSMPQLPASKRVTWWPLGEARPS